MRCPSCGAIIKKRSMKCPECGAFRNRSWVDEQPQTVRVEPAKIDNPIDRKSAGSDGPSLIAFPGTAHKAVPQWRKELGERVREVQERRAREATVEPDCTIDEVAVRPAPQLELLPQAELPPMNPIVAAALERIERAHARPQFSGNTAVATLPHYDQPEVQTEQLLSGEVDLQPVVAEEPDVNENPPPAEKVHNLAVVPPPSPKPKRLIRDDNDPALNYLDSLPTTVGVDVAHHSAPIAHRILSGFVDLAVICLIAVPAVALVEYNDLSWQDFRTIAFVAGTFAIAGFLYLTVITALTGRTVGMRLLSLRVVDARTGLIPTGAQSARRALIYMLSLASAGIVLLYTFIDRERCTIHDRFSHTAVIRL
jgi:uncharacterized RDD family membrane protein YckC